MAGGGGGNECPVFHGALGESLEMTRDKGRGEEYLWLDTRSGDMEVAVVSGVL